MKDHIIELAVKVLQSNPEGLYCSQLMKDILKTAPELGGGAFGFHLRNWKKEDAFVETPLLASHDETGFFQLAPAMIVGAKTYTAEELAQILQISPETLVQWKKSGRIPKKFLTPDGRYVKSLIDPLVEAYRQAAPDPKPESFAEEDRLQMAILHEEGISVQEIAQKYQCDVQAVLDTLHGFGISVEMTDDETKTVLADNVPRKKCHSRKHLNFNATDIDRMLELHQQGTKMDAIAKEFGCSASTVSRLLRQRKTDEPADESRPVSPQSRPFPTDEIASNSVGFEIFVRNYWSTGSRAADMLLLPQEIRAKILDAVNAALRYSYERLHETGCVEVEVVADEPGMIESVLSANDIICTKKTEIQIAPRQTKERRAGRPKGTGKYGCETKPVRVPIHLAAEVAEFARSRAAAENGRGDRAYRRTPK